MNLLIAAKGGAPWWLTVSIALIGLASTLGAVLLKDHLERKKANEGRAIGVYFDKAHEVYQIIGTAKRLLGAQRALIIRSENGGGVPKPGAQIYISVVYESFDPPLSSCRDDFQRHPVDAQYMGLLDEVYHMEYVLLDPSKMEYGFLQDYYRSVGIEKSEVVRLHASDSYFLYMSLNYHKPNEGAESVGTESPKHRSHLRDATHKLSTIFREMEELAK